MKTFDEFVDSYGSASADETTYYTFLHQIEQETTGIILGKSFSMYASWYRDRSQGESKYYSPENVEKWTLEFNLAFFMELFCELFNSEPYQVCAIEWMKNTYTQLVKIVTPIWKPYVADDYQPTIAEFQRTVCDIFNFIAELRRQKNIDAKTLYSEISRKYIKHVHGNSEQIEPKSGLDMPTYIANEYSKYSIEVVEAIGRFKDRYQRYKALERFPAIFRKY